MENNQDVDIFLQHHGIKGMQWGIRNKEHLDRVNRVAKGTEQNIRRRKKVPRTTFEKVMLGYKIAGYSFLGLTVALAILDANRTVPISNIPKHPSNMSSVEQVIRNAQSKQYSSLARMHAEGKMDAQQFKIFGDTLNARYDRKVVDALKGL